MILGEWTQILKYLFIYYFKGFREVRKEDERSNGNRVWNKEWN